MPRDGDKDIVVRLRLVAKTLELEESPNAAKLLREAAAEIERLRRTNPRLRKKLITRDGEKVA
jgi:hypothetical protein